MLTAIKNKRPGLFCFIHARLKIAKIEKGKFSVNVDFFLPYVMQTDYVTKCLKGKQTYVILRDVAKKLGWFTNYNCVHFIQNTAVHPKWCTIWYKVSLGSLGSKIKSWSLWLTLHIMHMFACVHFDFILSENSANFSFGF